MVYLKASEYPIKLFRKSVLNARLAKLCIGLYNMKHFGLSFEFSYRVSVLDSPKLNKERVCKLGERVKHL